MSVDEARRWLDDPNGGDLSIETLTDQIRDYANAQAEAHGGDFRLLFMADEIGQFIGSDSNLKRPNLQTIVEELGTKCAGRVWVMVTSQEAIDEVTKVVGQDFSKIQGRFNTRLSLSSSSADEVIKRRILEKNEPAADLLHAQYAETSSCSKNLFTFEKSTETSSATRTRVSSSIPSLCQLPVPSHAERHVRDPQSRKHGQAPLQRRALHALRLPGDRPARRGPRREHPRAVLDVLLRGPDLLRELHPPRH